MEVKINDQLLQTRNPTELEFQLQKKQGKVIQVLGDGYNLVKFKDLFIKKFIKHDKKWKLVHLEWYVHDKDFTAIT